MFIEKEFTMGQNAESKQPFVPSFGITAFGGENDFLHLKIIF
jgi:hypothetical protein